MSAIVCGKRSFFEELQAPSPAKKLRCSSSTSPVRFSPPINQLREIFPNMDNQILEEVLGRCGNDLDSATKMLHELSLRHAESNSGSAMEANAGIEEIPSNGESEDPLIQQKVPTSGADWVELIVREMKSATSIDDAGARASRVLESFEKFINSNATSEAAQGLQKENMMLKEQLEIVLQENAILKRGVAIQHERHKENDDRVQQEAQHLKQLLTQYREQIRTLEVNNYGLTMHLQQAQQNSSMPGRRHPDVF